MKKAHSLQINFLWASFDIFNKNKYWKWKEMLHMCIHNLGKNFHTYKK